jgi:hypothetical protein
MSTKKFGTRQDIWDGLATMTRGGLTKIDLVLSKTGRIVSKKKSDAARVAYEKFGFKKREEPKKRKRKRRKQEEEKE